MPIGYLFVLVLATGEPADPPTFTSAHWKWAPGDEIVIGPTPKYRVVDVDMAPPAGYPDAQGVFVVEPL